MLWLVLTLRYLFGVGGMAKRSAMVFGVPGVMPALRLGMPPGVHDTANKYPGVYRPNHC